MPKVRYTIYDVEKDEPLIVGGTIEECAEAMGMKKCSFSKIPGRVRNGSNKNWIILKCSEERGEPAEIVAKPKKPELSILQEMAMEEGKSIKPLPVDIEAIVKSCENTTKDDIQLIEALENKIIDQGQVIKDLESTIKLLRENLHESELYNVKNDEQESLKAENQRLRQQVASLIDVCGLLKDLVEEGQKWRN